MLSAGFADGQYQWCWMASRWLGSEPFGLSAGVFGASQVVLVVKNPPANIGGIKRWEFDPWVRKIPWRRACQPTPVFYSCLNPMDRGVWQATVHGITKSQTWLKWLSIHVHNGVFIYNKAWSKRRIKGSYIKVQSMDVTGVYGEVREAARGLILEFKGKVGPRGKSNEMLAKVSI